MKRGSQINGAYIKKDQLKALDSHSSVFLCKHFILSHTQSIKAAQTVCLVINTDNNNFSRIYRAKSARVWCPDCEWRYYICGGVSYTCVAGRAQQQQLQCRPANPALPYHNNTVVQSPVPPIRESQQPAQFGIQRGMRSVWLAAALLLPLVTARSQLHSLSY